MSGINIVGPGGIIEGATNDVDVNVNLDAALDFDGTDDIVDLNYGSGVNAQAGFSVSFWAKLDDNFTGSPNQMFIGSSTGTNQRFYIGTNSTRWSFGYASSGWSSSGAMTAFAGAWHHVCVTATSGAQKLYVNGVEITAQAKTDSSTFTLASDLGAGAMFGGTYYSNGTMADIKIFSDVLTQPEVAELASKINYDITAGSIDNLTRWFKMNAGTGTTIADDSGNSGTAADITGATWIFDPYYVDVQDNSTGGSGLLTVTQGQLNCKSMTSLTFDGSADNIDTNITFQSEIRDGFSMSAWVKPDDGITGANQGLIGSFTDSNHSFVLYIDSGAGKLSARIVTDGATKYAVENIASFANGANPWKHVALTVTYVDSSNATMKLYVNGEERTLDSSNNGALSGNLGNYNGADIRIGINPYSGGFQWDFAGKIRDVRFNDNVLSADQIASLCSNTYPATPNYWWKVNDNGLAPAGAAYVQSFGTATDPNAVRNGATWNNGTYTQTGKLTLGGSGDSSVKGILSAPRGIFHLTADFQSFGTLTHNDGTFKLDNGSAMHVYNALGGANQREATFYNVTMAGTGVDGYRISGPITIEKDWIIDGTRTSVSNNAGGGHNSGVVVTLGTTTSAGSITINSGKELETYTYANSHSVTYQGASTIYPAVFTNNGTFEETLGSLLETTPTCKLGNIKFATDFATRPEDGQAGGGSKLILVGDMEFEDFTLTLGDDTLDLATHRCQINGDMTCASSSSLDIADSLLVVSGHVDWNGIVPTAGTGAKIIHDTSAEKNWRSMYGTDATFFANGTQTTITDYHWGGAEAPAKVIAGGIFNTNLLNVTSDDVTIPVGGEYKGQAQTLTVAGDWTSSGGLIGKSAFDFDGASGLINAGNNSSIDNIFAGGGTIEAWINVDGDGETDGARIFDKSWDLRTFGHSGDTVKIEFSQFFASGKYQFQTGAVLTTGKWHHIAMTYNNAAPTNRATLYIDGKSVALTTTVDTGAGAATDDSSTDLIIGNRAADDKTLDGRIAMIRMFGDVRTQSEIRADMFNKFADMDDDGDLELMYQFDEGTGTSVADVSAESNTGTITAGSSDWVGGGTFTQGTSTVDLTGTGTLTHQGDIDFNILKCAAATKTTTISKLSTGYININTNLYKGAGTLARGSSLSWRWSWKSGTGAVNNSGLSVSGASYPVDLSNTYVVYYHDATIAKEVKWNYFINGTDTTLAANQETTGYWNTALYKTDIGDYHLKCHHMKLEGPSSASSSQVNIDAGSLELSSTNGLLQSYPGNVFTAGPGARIYGSDVALSYTFKSQNDWTVVGNINNLNVTNEELKVTGLVTDCTGDIHQYFPTIDHDQQIDADTADDRDIQLHGDKLDRNTELINS